MKTTRTLLAVAAVIGGLVALAGPAQAAPPPTQTTAIDLPGTGTGGSNGYCSFPVHIDYISHQRDMHSTRPDGSMVDHFTGDAYATVTNTLTGKSFAHTISGPGTSRRSPTAPSPVDAAGPNLL
jgi:hypothetical protein